ncbi:DNA mismatch repair protein msh3 [Phtheirospermum japonicum]|uniref:DNA mismatch repair protein n=1 Tax=Phtheirospermum japonicum TaxID=374723 RepID=A0A830BBR1_9LAMI|nr:DNA mismatch repair protein msh3 [Phtheirospermum japonicum]
MRRIWGVIFNNLFYFVSVQFNGDPVYRSEFTLNGSNIERPKGAKPKDHRTAKNIAKTAAANRRRRPLPPWASRNSKSFPASSHPNPTPPPALATANPPTTPPPKIATTVSFSPAKRIRTSQLKSIHNNKLQKLSHPSPSESPNLPLPNPTLHQKFLAKLLEPPQDLLEPSRNSNRSEIPNPKYTPLEQQVVELKNRYPDVLLMIEVGYKYRFFGSDAENAARTLGIYAHMDHNFLTASVPTIRLNVHVRRLVSAGYKVGVVKQTETAAIKAHGSNRLGPFCRGLSALYTKATLEAAEDLGGGEEECRPCNNYLFCVVEKNVGGMDVRVGGVGVEISTGDVVYGEFDDDFMRAGLEAMILHLSPAELLLGGTLSKQTEKLLLAYAGPASNVRVEHASQDCLHDCDVIAEVMSQYESLNESNVANGHQQQVTTADTRSNKCSGLEGIMAMPELAIQALALTIHHLKQFGFERILCLGASFRPFSSITEMTLSANALQQLEASVLKNNYDGSERGSLLQCMNHTLTVFGSRLLRHWVTHPLCDRNMIHARQDAVSEILESMGSTKASDIDLQEENSDITIVHPDIHHLLTSVLTTLGRVPDVQRGITRIFHRTASASEFIAVIQAIVVAGRQLQKLHVEIADKTKNRQVKTVRSVLLRKLILTASSPSVTGTATKLLSKLNKEAADQRDLHNLFIVSDGSFPEVATAWTKVCSANEMLDQLLSLYRKQLRMSNLEFMSVSGVTHLIELSLDVKVPSDWVKVNSTKKTIRYHPSEVLNALNQLTLANEELSIVCRTAWEGFLKTFAGFYSEFQASVQALATLDCLHSLATLSRTKDFVRPIFVSDDETVQINIKSGRHPVMESILQDNFVPNDTYLDADGQYCQIVTGPNMGGKSCYIRQVALIALMAQVGCFVPASSAKLHVLDGIYTRMGASDSIQLGKSTFLEELSEASHILQHCTSRSLLIIDELGRGTSTHDGVAIAYATLHYLLEHKKCMVLFVTHYPEIVDIRNEFPGSVGAYHVSYLTPHKEKNLEFNVDLEMDTVNHDDVTYLYKLVPGVSERSFGFKVAQLAQLPSSCIRRATEMAAKLEAEVCKREKNKLLSNCSMSYNKSEHAETLEKVDEAYRELFFYLNLALNDAEASEKRFDSLKHAKSLAIGLAN